jgi:hypothetical protein
VGGLRGAVLSIQTFLVDCLEWLFAVYVDEPFQTFLFNGQCCALHRMDLQRELAKVKGAKKDKGASSSASGAGGSAGKAGMNPEDADMLEMTLGMLRCSVCKDRFKSCAITRYEKAWTWCCALFRSFSRYKRYAKPPLT